MNSYKIVIIKITYILYSFLKANKRFLKYTTLNSIFLFFSAKTGGLTNKSIPVFYDAVTQVYILFIQKNEHSVTKMLNFLSYNVQHEKTECA